MILDSIEDNANYSYEYAGAKPYPQGINFSNDGSSDCTLTVGSIAITIKPGETFDGSFERFTAASIVASDSFRMLVRR